jgi:hypothetical protein
MPIALDVPSPDACLTIGMINGRTAAVDVM